MRRLHHPYHHGKCLATNALLTKLDDQGKLKHMRRSIITHLLLIWLCFAPAASYANSNHPVTVIGVEITDNVVKVVLQAVNNKKPRFTVIFTQQDTESFRKLAYILDEAINPLETDLFVRILSFSQFPDGAIYQSQHVEIYTSNE